MKTLQLFAASLFFIIACLAIISWGSPWEYLTGADPLRAAAVVCGGFMAASFALAWITGDYSQTDRLWSVLPALYAWYFAARGWPDGRLALMAALATLWGARLTFNFARKGGYTSAEDYRWAFLRTRIPGAAAWQAFNLTFIAGYQHFLILLFSLPAYAAYRDGTAPLGWKDAAAAGLFLVLLAVETIADEQMWRFQQEKKKRAAAGTAVEGDYKRGFITSGLYGLSRHPNYFAEVSIWWAFYLFVPAATGSWLHWTITGALLLTLLFQGSIWLAEHISSGKYPAYAEYQKKVSRCIPWFGRPME